MKRKFTKLIQIGHINNALQEVQATQPKSEDEDVRRVREMKKIMAAVQKSS